MILQVIMLIAGFVLLVKGADWFVEGAASIAKNIGVPQLIICLTIVAMGTSMSEAAVSMQAALADNAGISVGNIVGSNILNILIILGITAVITNVAIQKSTLIYEIPFMTGITVLFMIFGVAFLCSLLIICVLSPRIGTAICCFGKDKQIDCQNLFNTPLFKLDALWYHSLYSIGAVRPFE